MMVDMPRMPNDWIQQLRGIFFAKDRSPIISAFNWLGLPLISTPSVNPTVDNLYIYPKSDKEFYKLDWDGNESLISSQIQLIEEVELTADVAEINFNQIPQNFRTLILICQLRTDSAAEIDDCLIRFNSDNGPNYDYVFLYGRGDNTQTSGSGLAANSILLGDVEADNSRASNYTTMFSCLPGYSRSDREKIINTCSHGVFGNRNVNTDYFSLQFSGTWRSLSIISSITLLPNVGNNVKSGSIAQLYGLL